MKVIDQLCSVILGAFAVLTAYKTAYVVFGFLLRAKRYPAAAQRKRYGVLIAARNESAVIGNLLDSIRAQTYPADQVTVFVVADNCTDDTAAICRSKGAVVYERFDPAHARKGYAMQFLVDRLRSSGEFSSCDGFFVFDADNLLAPDFIERMNEAFEAGSRVVTSYRNTKNFGTNAVSAAYGIHFYRNTMAYHRPRSVLGLGTHLTGTGYLLDAALLADGWLWTNLTEDDELTCVLAGKGEFVAYCEAAEFFDEQPIDFRTALRQRMRWARGRLVNFFRNGFRVGAGVFRVKTGWRGMLSCYDLFFHYFPYGVFNWLLGLIYPAAHFISGLLHPGVNDYRALGWNLLTLFGSKYAAALVTGALTVIREHRHLHCRPVKAALYALAYPWFPMISVYIYFAALFVNVRWTPIAHVDRSTIGDLTAPERAQSEKRR